MGDQAYWCPLGLKCASIKVEKNFQVYFSEFRKYIVAARDYYHYCVATYIGLDYTDALYILKEEIFKIVEIRLNEKVG